MANATSASSRTASKILFWIAVLATALPFLVVDVAPLCDLPNHLGRIHVLANLDKVSGYSEFYVEDPVILPNLALDSVATPLARFMPTTRASQVFCLMMALSVVLGAAAVAYAQRRSAGVAAALAACCLHTVSLEYGFVNYTAGIGCALLAIAAWIRSRDMDPTSRMTLSVPLALVVFFCHLMPFVFYGVIVASYEIARAVQRRSKGAPLLLAFESAPIAAAQFIAPVVLYLGYSPTAAELGGTWTSVGFGKKLSQLVSVFRIGDGDADLVFTGAVLAVGLLLFIITRPQLRLTGLLSLAGMLLLFFIAPQKTATADNISIRIPAAIALVFAAFIGLHTDGHRHRLRVLTFALAGLTIGRSAQITWKWWSEADTYTAIRQGFGAIREGSTLFTLRDVPNRVEIRRTWHPPLAHVAGLALLEHPVWVPQLFANEGQQPLVVRNPSLLETRSPRGDPMPTYRSPEDFGRWLDEFRRLHQARELSRAAADYEIGHACVLHLHGTDRDSLRELPLRRAVQLAQGDRWTLWQLPL